MIRAAFDILLLSLVRDEDARLSNDDINGAVNNALYRLNQDQPKQTVVDVSANNENIISVPIGFEQNFSQVLSVEYPINARPRSYLNDVYIYQEPTGQVLDLPEAITGSLRITFTVRHHIDTTSSSFTFEQQEPLACYAASILCGQLATLYSHDTSSVIQGDSVDHASKADLFRRRARELDKRYQDYIGIDKPKGSASGVVVSVSNNKSYLTHKSRQRAMR
ncbi:MAG: hypothetical protein COB35_05000 [Gammaproteobacteria bacterium]|nr:MAG: hypothetical protein COB35_05000 [Gammaproteobacteria bacterium]